MDVIQRQGLQGQKQGTWMHTGETGGAIGSHMSSIRWRKQALHSFYTMGSRGPAAPSWARP